MKKIACRSCIHYISILNTCGGDSNICLMNPEGVQAKWKTGDYKHWQRENSSFSYIYWFPCLPALLAESEFFRENSQGLPDPDFLSDEDFEL